MKKAMFEVTANGQTRIVTIDVNSNVHAFEVEHQIRAELKPVSNNRVTLKSVYECVQDASSMFELYELCMTSKELVKARNDHGAYEATQERLTSEPWV